MDHDRRHELLPRPRHRDHIAVDFEDCRTDEQQPPVHSSGTAVTSERLAPCRCHLRRNSLARLPRWCADGTSPGSDADPESSTRPQHAAIATSLDDARSRCPKGFFQGQIGRGSHLERRPDARPDRCGLPAGDPQRHWPSRPVLDERGPGHGCGRLVRHAAERHRGRWAHVGSRLHLPGGHPERPAGGRLGHHQPGFAAHQRHLVGDRDEPRPEQ